MNSIKELSKFLLYEFNKMNPKSYLAGRSSLGRVWGVQTGSPTNSLIAYKNFRLMQVASA